MTTDKVDHKTLDELSYLATVVREDWPSLSSERMRGQMYCPSCGGKRRMVVVKKYSQGFHQPVGSGLRVFNEIVPLLMTFACVQCSANFVVLVHKAPGGVALAIFPEGRGTLATPHTPPSVTYYLDQVQKCWSVGAYPAAISMYRTALDHLLYGEGFIKGMVGQKLRNLQKKIDAGSAPGWARELDISYLEVLSKLANYALHANDGDVRQQAIFDQDLLTAVKATFQELLFRAYELPNQAQDRLETLKSALRSLDET